MNELITHTLEPIYDNHSNVLILGTMPSPKSREAGFYYSHPQNRFWPVMAAVFSCDVPRTNEEKRTFLFENHIALWDVLQSCEMKGAEDSSIKNPLVNDIGRILNAADIKKIFTTGKKATVLYTRMCYPITGRASVYLPSTSPANCARYSLSLLTEEYKALRKQ